MTAVSGHGRRHWVVGCAVGLCAIAASIAGEASHAQAAAASTAPTFVRTIGHAGDAFVYPWGMATEPALGGPWDGDIIVGDYNNYDIKVFQPNGAFVAKFGSRGTGLGQMGQPYGIAVDPNDGSIYVADLNNRRIDKFSNTGVPLYTIVPSFAYYAPFVAVNHEGDVFLVQSTGLSHTAPNIIYEYDNHGNAITTFGVNGSSCSAGQFALIRGIDVDAADRLYVDDVGNRCIQVFNTATTPWTIVDSFGSKSTLSNNTRGMAIDRTNGYVYVADAAKQVVDVFTTWNGVSGGAYVGTIGTPGTDPGQLQGPRGIAVGLNGTVYVSDYTQWTIDAYASPVSANPRAFMLSAPNPSIPPPAGGFNNPTSVAVSTWSGSAGDVYVADTFNMRIQQFTGSGGWLGMWGSRLPQLGAGYALDYPRGVAVDPRNGNVWVNDTRSGYIKEYSANGTFISDFGGQGQANGQFYYSSGIAVGPTGNIYVTDTDNDRLQVLTQSGTEVAGFPVPCGSGFSAGGAAGCTGVTVDAAGNIYAAAPEKGVVYVFSSTGALVGTIGATAPGGSLGEPWDVAIVGTTLYVTESTNNRVSEFNIASTTGPYPYLGNFGTRGSGNGQLNRPLGISVDAAGRIYVVDYTNSRVEVFAP